MIKKFEDKMQKSIESLEREYNSIRAGRANPHVLDKIKVDYYGTPTPLQQVGNISVRTKNYHNSALGDIPFKGN